MSDELYKERAEWAELEGDIERESQFMTQGGLMHRFAMWCLKHVRQGRLGLQEKIDESMKGKHDEN